MIQFRFELPGIESLKDKRRILVSLKDRLHRKFNLSVAEVAEQDTLSLAHLGAAVVSNSRAHGEAVLTKAISFAESEVPGRLIDMEVFSENY